MGLDQFVCRVSKVFQLRIDLFAGRFGLFSASYDKFSSQKKTFWTIFDFFENKPLLVKTLPSQPQNPDLYTGTLHDAVMIQRAMIHKLERPVANGGQLAVC